jgi:hypothetical protein
LPLHFPLKLRVPDLNRTKNHNKTQTSDFHQSSLRGKKKIPVKITLDTLNQASTLDPEF